jgi:hypothetical protein
MHRACLLLILTGCLTTTVGAEDCQITSPGNPDDLTWEQSFNFIFDYKDSVLTDLVIDPDGPGPNDPMVFLSRMSAAMELQFIDTVDQGDGTYKHTFSVEGTISYWEECGCQMMLNSIFQDARFESISTDPGRIGAEALLHASDGVVGSLEYWAGPVLMNEGIREFDSPAWFAVQLTNINHGAGAALDDGLLEMFSADGAFDGGAVIPAPAGLLVLLPTLLIRRR